jgi:hypothetical protein
METLIQAVWQGLVDGASIRDRAAVPPPQTRGFPGSISQALYWAGYQFTNVLVYGAKK